MLQSVVERWGFVLAGALVLAYMLAPLVKGRLRGRLMRSVRRRSLQLNS